MGIATVAATADAMSSEVFMMSLPWCANIMRDGGRSGLAAFSSPIRRLFGRLQVGSPRPQGGLQGQLFFKPRRGDIEQGVEGARRLLAEGGRCGGLRLAPEPHRLGEPGTGPGR